MSVDPYPLYAGPAHQISKFGHLSFIVPPVSWWPVAGGGTFHPGRYNF